VSGLPGPPRPTGATVIVCDDRRLLAESLTSYLSGRQLVETASAVPDGDIAVRAARDGADVLVLSVGHTGTTDVTDVLEALHNLGAETAVVAVAPPQDVEALTSALALGATAVCCDDVPPADIYDAVRQALAHQPVIPVRLVADVVERLATQHGNATHEPDRLSLLTDRELEVLRLLAAGLTRSMIAARLGVSPNTARTHVGNMMRKLDVHSQHAAAAKGAQMMAGLAPGPLRRR
jgi:DNA-binding NarL/FixJ family response regulator